ncbi:MAG: peptidyl-prolyl cis-trans isomerase [Rhodospirillaceae bacterium]|nr:peptidyl-prolyl cis-trans isomerase [Rhodospirillaceae bacterium]
MAKTLRVLAAALLFSAAMTVATTAKSQSVQRIAAIVNDELITAYDLESRIRLVVFSTRLPNTIDTRRRISSQVLRTLIDERLQMQEAKRRNISVSRRDLQRAKETIEKQNRLPKGGLEQVMKQNGIPLESINEQLRTGIAWSKLIGRRLRPRITIGEDEIDESLERIRSRQGQAEYRLSEILLTVDSPDQEANIRRTAERITDQVKKGARFNAIARQFSQSATAAVGGDLGWQHESELDDTLRQVIGRMGKGSMTSPIKTVAGYRILLLRDVRKIAQSEAKPITLDLRQIFLPLPKQSAPSDIEAQIDLAKIVRDTASSCSDFSTLAKEVGSPRPPSLGKLGLKDLSPAIRQVVKDIPAGKISDPLKMPDGVMVLMVCNRDGGTSVIKLPKRDEIADRLMNERMSLGARRYMRDIRLSAVIDVRV